MEEPQHYLHTPATIGMPPQEATEHWRTLVDDPTMKKDNSGFRRQNDSLRCCFVLSHKMELGTKEEDIEELQQGDKLKRFKIDQAPAPSFDTIGSGLQPLALGIGGQAAVVQLDGSGSSSSNGVAFPTSSRGHEGLPPAAPPIDSKDCGPTPSKRRRSIGNEVTNYVLARKEALRELSGSVDSLLSWEKEKNVAEKNADNAGLLEEQVDVLETIAERARLVTTWIQAIASVATPSAAGVSNEGATMAAAAAAGAAHGTKVVVEGEMPAIVAAVDPSAPLRATIVRARFSTQCPQHLKVLEVMREDAEEQFAELKDGFNLSFAAAQQLVAGLKNSISSYERLVARAHKSAKKIEAKKLAQQQEAGEAERQKDAATEVLRKAAAAAAAALAPTVTPGFRARSQGVADIRARGRAEDVLGGRRHRCGSRPLGCILDSDILRGPYEGGRRPPIPADSQHVREGVPIAGPDAAVRANIRARHGGTRLGGSQRGHQGRMSAD